MNYVPTIIKRVDGNTIIKRVVVKNRWFEVRTQSPEPGRVYWFITSVYVRIPWKCIDAGWRWQPLYATFSRSYG